jgi:hypothetical protein
MVMPHKNVDVSLAARFGKLVVLFPTGQERPGFWDPELVEEALDRMWDQHFDPDKDYLLIAGHMAPVVRIACALAREQIRAKALFWDSVSRHYVALPLAGTVIELPHTEYRFQETKDGDESSPGAALQRGEVAARELRKGRRRAS